MYKFITVIGIVSLLFLAACERQEQRTLEPAQPSTTEQQRETPPPGQQPEQAPAQPGEAPGQAPAAPEQRQGQ